MEKRSRICHWEVPEGSIFVWQQQVTQFESPKESKTASQIPVSARSVHRAVGKQRSICPVLLERFGFHKEETDRLKEMRSFLLVSPLWKRAVLRAVFHIPERTQSGILITLLLQKLQRNSEAIPLGAVQMHSPRYSLPESAQKINRKKRRGNVIEGEEGERARGGEGQGYT